MHNTEDGPKPWQTRTKTRKTSPSSSKGSKTLKPEVFAYKGFEKMADMIDDAPNWVLDCRESTKDKSHTPISDWKECLAGKFEAGSQGQMTYSVQDMDITHEMMERNADPELAVVNGAEWAQYMAIRWYDSTQHQLGWKIDVFGDPKE